jgi:hypothetical protein
VYFMILIDIAGCGRFPCQRHDTQQLKLQRRQNTRTEKLKFTHAIEMRIGMEATNSTATLVRCSNIPDQRTYW